MKMRINNEKKSNTTATDGKRKVRNDIILISALLVIVVIAALSLFLLMEEGDTVVVTVDGKLFGEYRLDEDREVEIRNGDGYNLLVIEGGRAHVKVASCPDGICSSHRPVERDGESIICLPNKVVIEIRKQNDKQPDIIA